MKTCLNGTVKETFGNFRELASGAPFLKMMQVVRALDARAATGAGFGAETRTRVDLQLTWLPLGVVAELIRAAAWV